MFSEGLVLMDGSSPYTGPTFLHVFLNVIFMLPPPSHGEPSYSLLLPKAVLSPTMSPQAGRAQAGSLNYCF